mgnify:CR=1 FL=1
MKNTIIAIVTAIVAVMGSVLYINNQQPPLGANPGPEYYSLQSFLGGMVQGGELTTLTSSATTTFTAKQLCDSSVIKWNTTNVVGSTTFPTAATIINTCLSKNGAFKDIVLWNSGLATQTIAFTANTGNTIYIPEATGADKVIEGLNYARIRFVRTSGTTVVIFIDEELVQ